MQHHQGGQLHDPSSPSTSKGKAAAREAAAKGIICDCRGIRGHKIAECRKMQAEKGDGRETKRARTDISSLEDQLGNLSLQVQELTGNSSGVPS
eukprot:3175266-Amphidinium_carterae.1